MTLDEMAASPHGSGSVPTGIAAAALPWGQAVASLCEMLAATAVERDKVGGHAGTERQLLKDSGLLALSVPQDLGGLGATWSQTLEVVRHIARVDSAIAHVFAFHHLLLASVRLFGNESQWRPWIEDTVRDRLFWGNALNPLDKGTVAREPSADISKSNAGQGGSCHTDVGTELTDNKGRPDGSAALRYLFDGRKGFCSGATRAERLLVSAFDASDRLLIAVIPGDREGVQVLDDWDNMGQRQTDSGTVLFDQVPIYGDELLLEPGPLSSPFACLRPVLAQLTLANLYLGIGEGALAAAKAFAGGSKRAWLASKAATAQEDPYVLRHFGELWVGLEGARTLTDRAAVWFDAAWRRDLALTEAERAAAALATASAKVASARAALDVCNRMFEVTGARSTAAHFGLDRYWRNLRVHTLHDPIDYKLQELGDWALNDHWPKPTFYS